MSTDRYLDLLKQGFMKSRKAPKASPTPRSTVACDDCLNWHPKGKHSADAATRKANRKAAAEAKQRGDEAKQRPAHFIAWATERDGNSMRYAIVDRAPCPGIGWVRVASDGRRVQESGGAFYDGVAEHPEGAIAWAIASAKDHQQRMQGLLAQP